MKPFSRLGIRILFVLTALFLVTVRPVMAQTTYSGLDGILNKIIMATPGLNTVGIANGVTVAAADSVMVTNGALRIPMLATATATVGKASMAAAAGKLLLNANALGLAVTAFQVYQWVKDSGIQVCPPPGMFCKPTPSAQLPGTFSLYNFGGSYTSTASACQVAIDRYKHDYPNNPTIQAWSFGSVDQRPDINFQNAYSCKSSSGDEVDIVIRQTTTPCTVDSCNTNTPYTQEELVTAVTGTNWDPDRSKKMRDALVADSAAHPGILTTNDVTPYASPVTVTAPPVTTPQTVTRVATITNPDGTTSTQTTKAMTTVTPVQTGTTLADSKLDPRVSTVTTTTTVNNTTNATTTNTTTTNPATPATEEDTGPKECGTPGKPKCQIDETGTPDKSSADTAIAQQKTDIDTIVADQIQKGKDVAGIENRDTSFGWFPSFPAGQCSPFVLSSKIPPVDWCPVVPRLKDMVSWIWAMAAIFACAFLVQSSLKA